MTLQKRLYDPSKNVYMTRRAKQRRGNLEGSQTDGPHETIKKNR